MRAYILGTGRRVSPFDDRPGDLTFGFTTFAAATEGALARRAVDVSRVPVGAAPPDPGGPCLVLGDHVYASEKCLHDFLNLSAASDAVEQLALCRTPASDYARPVSSVGVEPLDEEGPGARPADGKGPEAAASERVVYDCFYVPAGKLPPRLGGAELLAALRAEARARVVKKNEIGVEVRLPLLGDPEHTRMIYPITSTVAGHVEHWVHVLWLNHQAFGVQWMERVRRRPLWALLRLLTCVPPTRDNIIRRFVARGKNVRIHPTASVEGSILGDNVVIGARASVRNSILGDGVEVGDHAAVIACTLGDRAYVTPKTFFVWSTAFPDAVSNNLKTQMSILGRGAGT